MKIFIPLKHRLWLRKDQNRTRDFTKTNNFNTRIYLIKFPIITQGRGLLSDMCEMDDGRYREDYEVKWVLLNIDSWIYTLVLTETYTEKYVTNVGIS